MEMVVCGMLQIIRSLLGANWSPLRLCLSHPGPQEPRGHRALLRCPVSFGQPMDGLVFAAADLERSIAHANPKVRRMAEAHMRVLARDTARFNSVVSSLIAALLPSGRCSASAVAGHLGIDRSTMSRRLLLANTSYSELLQEARMTLADRCRHTRNPLSEVALQLGFENPSAFSRWFRSSFGASARSWRKRVVVPSIRQI